MTVHMYVIMMQQIVLCSQSANDENYICRNLACTRDVLCNAGYLLIRLMP